MFSIFTKRKDFFDKLAENRMYDRLLREMIQDFMTNELIEVCHLILDKLKFTRLNAKILLIGTNL